MLTRGAWLVFLELSFLRLAWTFNFDFAHYEMAGVIWAIGWCMILMAGLVKLSPRVIGIVGLLIIAGHNLMDPFFFTIAQSLGNGFGSAIWKIMYIGPFAGPISLGPDGPNLIVLYSLVPWIGVMAAGYAFGTIITLDPKKRDQLCLGIGLGAIALFVILRGFNLYGDPRPWVPAAASANGMPAFLSFLNAAKYPASLSFLLMTLGPTIALIPLLEKARGWLSQKVSLFGRVPFFFYVLHIPLIHVIALLVSLIMTGEVNPWLFANHPMGSGPAPEGYVWSLGLLYLVWAVVIVILYYACRWFAAVKSRRSEWWLRYL